MYVTGTQAIQGHKVQLHMSSILLYIYIYISSTDIANKKKPVNNNIDSGIRYYYILLDNDSLRFPPQMDSVVIY